MGRKSLFDRRDMSGAALRLVAALGHARDLDSAVEVAGFMPASLAARAAALELQLGQASRALFVEPERPCIVGRLQRFNG